MLMQTKARRKKSSRGGKLAVAGTLAVDHSRLAMEYHNAIVAGLALASVHLSILLTFQLKLCCVVTVQVFNEFIYMIFKIIGCQICKLEGLRFNRYLGSK